MKHSLVALPAWAFVLAAGATAGQAQVPAQAQSTDVTARAEAAQALAAANAPAITKTTVVATDVAGTPAVAGSGGTVPSTPMQVNASNPETAGYLGFRYGPDGAGVSNYWVKTRGTKMNDYSAVQLGDRIVSDFWQAGTGAQTGHAGGMRVVVDSAAFSPGEVAGRWMVFTGTGIHSGSASAQYPGRFGSLNALVVNSYQQVLLPGGLGGPTPAPSANFGGWLVIGAGDSAPGFGPLKFLASGAKLLAVPEAGSFEVDASATPYFTRADGVRRAFVLADTGTPTVSVFAAAGSGASASIDAQGSSGVITVVTGTAPSAGAQIAVTYPHPYAAASYPVLSAANANGVALARDGFVTATAIGFTISMPAGLAPGTTYAVNYYAPGK